MSAVDLISSTNFTTTVKAMIPQEEKGVSREVTFDATFRVLPQDDWEALVDDSTKSEALREVLVRVKSDQIEPTEVENPHTGEMEKLSEKDIVVRNPFTCDAAFAEYGLYMTKNSRDKAIAASSVKNSRRSRKR